MVFFLGNMQVWLYVVGPQLCTLLSDSALKANMISKFYAVIPHPKNSYHN